MLNQEALERAMRTLGTLEEDPQGLNMSRVGAEIYVHEMAEMYAFDQKGTKKFGTMPAKVKRELLQLAQKTNELSEALHKASRFATEVIWMIDAHQMGEYHSTTDWTSKLNYLESILQLAADHPQFNVSGGSLRLESMGNCSPNHLLVKKCRALLGACKRPHGGSKRGPLVELLSAVAGKPEATQTTFNNDIREVMNWPNAAIDHELKVAQLISYDLRRRRSKNHPDIQEIERVISDLNENIPNRNWDQDIKKMAMALGFGDQEN